MTSQVTRMPRAFASRIRSIEPAVETCVRCTRASAAPATRIARATADSSAAFGMPASPSIADTGPSFMTPLPERARSCGCSITKRSRERAYSSACWKRRASSTGEPSSENATAPAAASSMRSESSVPLRPRVIVAMGSTRAPPAATPRAMSSATRPGESIAGSVFGIAQTVVKPPRNAARAPVAIVSDSSKPGSRRCACRSMKPRVTRRP